MTKRGVDRAQLLTLAVAFGAGCFTCHVVERERADTLRSRGHNPRTVAALEERGPPTKQELGQSSWTLLHTMAANFPDVPTARQRARVENFLRGLGDLYPCPICAAHFRGHLADHPVQTGSREALSLWLCEAHNEVSRTLDRPRQPLPHTLCVERAPRAWQVNTRNKKEPFYCDIGVLDARWKDCGCDKNATASGSQHRRRA